MNEGRVPTAMERQVITSYVTAGAFPHVAARAAGVVPATFGEDGLVVLSPAESARLKADFVASGGPSEGDVAIWGGGVLPEEVAEYEAAGVTWMFTDGGAVELEELRAFVAAGPPGLRA